MANVRVATKGTLIKMGNGDGPPETFTAIGGITNVDGPSETYDEIEVTDLDSVAKEWEAALPDSGEVQLGYNFDPDSASQAALRAAKGTLKNFQIILNDATATKPVPTKLAFAAVVKGIGRSAEVGGVWKGTFTLRVSGAIAETLRAAS